MPDRPDPPDRAPSKGASPIAPGLYVGGWADAAEFTGTRFCVLDDLPEGLPPAEVHVPIYDPARDRPIVENLDRLARLVADARERGEPVLIFCGHGIRRGPLAGAWVLHRLEHLSLNDAYRRVEAARPQAERVERWIRDRRDLEMDRPG